MKRVMPKYYPDFVLSLIIILMMIFFQVNLNAADFIIAKVVIQEPCGLHRSLEYVDLILQYKSENSTSDELNIVAENIKNGERIFCQIIDKKIFAEESITSLHILFPVSIAANEQKVFLLKSSGDKIGRDSDLLIKGDQPDIVVENKYYRADLSKNLHSEAKSHSSGQLNELFIKTNYNRLLFRTENRMHWAPNFQKVGLEDYNTIAGWDNPGRYIQKEGPYLVYTHRRGPAPDHPEILVTANYYFYSGLPYFKFFSSMDVIKDVNLFLLRNDEMTMDSLFTNIAYQNTLGKIIDLPFSERYKELETNPVENNAPWLCFYNKQKGYAFGSIRVKYDNTNNHGLPSPTYKPHTKISDGAEGGKYWNRRLIDEYPMFVPVGSSYVEENAYLIFDLTAVNKFESIIEWTNIINHPVEVSLSYEF